MIQIVINPWFDRFILLVIIANCVVLSIENPNEEKGQAAEILDYIFLTLFTCEMVFKIIALGFVMRPYSYLRDAWNVVSLNLLTF